MPTVYARGMADKPGGDNTARLRKAVEQRARFGTPGGFGRCVTFLATKGVTGDKAKRICASFHHDVTGKWPAEDD